MAVPVRPEPGLVPDRLGRLDHDGAAVVVAHSAIGAFVPMTFRGFNQLHGVADPLRLGTGLFHF
jgi:hypothetical protein